MRALETERAPERLADVDIRTRRAGGMLARPGLRRSGALSEDLVAGDVLADVVCDFRLCAFVGAAGGWGLH